MPLHKLGGGVAIELIPNINEILDGGNVDIIYRREVKNYSVKDGKMKARLFNLPSTGARIIPRSILNMLVDSS
jgi:hypothetical protein